MRRGRFPPSPKTPGWLARLSYPQDARERAGTNGRASARDRREEEEKRRKKKKRAKKKKGRKRTRPGRPENKGASAARDALGGARSRTGASAPRPLFCLCTYTYDVCTSYASCAAPGRCPSSITGAPYAVVGAYTESIYTSTTYIRRAPSVRPRLLHCALDAYIAATCRLGPRAAEAPCVVPCV